MEKPRNIYKGNRYVPKIMGEWSISESYEGLSIVTNKGASYTSKKRVPIGIDLTNEEYWVVTGNYNVQIENYRNDIVLLKQESKEKFEKIDNAIPISVTSLGVNSLGVDSTLEMQLALKTYKKIHIPKGNYLFTNLEIPSDTIITSDDNAVIVISGEISNKIVSKKNYNHKILGIVKRGTFDIPLLSVVNVVIGDTIMVYDGMWKNPSDWLEHSKNENNDWWKKSFAKIVSISGNTVTLDKSVPFDISNDLGTIEFIEMDKNISIKGGHWNFTGLKIGFNFKQVDGLIIEHCLLTSEFNETILLSEYSLNGSIRFNKVIKKKNSVFKLFYFITGFTVSDNDIHVEDYFSGDACIQIYAYATGNKIKNNTIICKRTNQQGKDLQISGIMLTTVQDNLVSGNVIRGFMFGIGSYFGSKYNMIDSNEVSYNLVAGIHLYYTWHTTLTNNVIHSNGLDRRFENQQRGGIMCNETAKYIQIVNNNFHDNLHDIVFMKSLSHITVIGNASNDTYGYFIFLNKLNGLLENQTFSDSVISNNRYKPKNKADGAFLYSYTFNNERLTIKQNDISNTVNGLYQYLNNSINLIDSNIFTNVDSAINIGGLSNFNRIYTNTFLNCVKGVQALGQAKLNDYKDNIFIDCTKTYDFTDEFNQALDNTGLRKTSLLGFKIHSTTPASLVDYWQKVKETDNPLTDWVTVNK